MKSTLTLVCECFCSNRRSRFEMPLILQFATSSDGSVREFLKRMAQHGFFSVLHLQSLVLPDINCSAVSLILPAASIPVTVKTDKDSRKSPRFQRECCQGVHDYNQCCSSRPRIAQGLCHQRPCIFEIQKEAASGCSTCTLGP